MWSKALILRYSLIQIPGIIVLVVILFWLQPWLNLSIWLLWGVVLFWVVKDIVLFPLVWRAYDWEGAKKANSMVGLKGVAKENIGSKGYIQVGNERWLAEVVDGSEIRAGQRVEIVDIRGLEVGVRVSEEDGL